MTHCKIEALTPEAEASIGKRVMDIPHFPFRVGRESRLSLVHGELTVSERRLSAAAVASNDLYLLDNGHRLNVSRSHFQIESDGSDYQLVDRQSACGTIVGEEVVGGNDMGGLIKLKSGDLIVVGTSESPFVFRFIVS